MLRVSGWRIGFKITFSLIATTLLALLAVSAVFGQRARENLTDVTFAHLRSIAQQKVFLVEHLLEKNGDRMALLASRTQLRYSLRDWLTQSAQGVPPSEEHAFKMRKILNDAQNALGDLQHVAIYTTDSRLIVQTDRAPIADVQLGAVVPAGHVAGVDLQVVGSQFEHYQLRLIKPLELDGQLLGYLAADITLGEFDEILRLHAGLGRSEEVQLLFREGAGDWSALVGTSAQAGVSIGNSLDSGKSSHVNFSERMVDYRGNEVFAVIHSFEQLPWSMVFKIDVNDALSAVTKQEQLLRSAVLSALIASLLVAVVLSRQITRPVTRLTEVAQNIAAGDFSQRCGAPGQDEFGLLAQSVNQMADKLVNANRQLESRVAEKTQDLLQANKSLSRLNTQLQIISHEDQLTGLPNRRAFDERLRLEWHHSQRDARPISLIMLDIDLFKQLNDSAGHAVGDECLARVGRVLRQVINRNTDMAARYGGEEFVVLLPGTYSAQALVIAQRLQAAMQDEAIPHAHSSVSNHITFSGGIGAITPKEEDSPSVFLALVDRALYAAKAAGRNQFVRTSDLPIESEQTPV
ncbi:MAG: diguanylate cyclase domain-containing protein [Oceanococcus sp.]